MNNNFVMKNSHRDRKHCWGKKFDWPQMMDGREESDPNCSSNKSNLAVGVAPVEI